MELPELRRALEELHPQSFGWALSCCGYRPDDAEDVLQAVYLKIVEGRAVYGGRSSLKTWLFSVIRHTALQQQRRRWWRWSPQPETAAPRPDEQHAQGERQRLVRQALARLPRRQREVLDLVFYQGFTVDDAAAVMGCSRGSARTHYERAKRHLRTTLGGLT